MTEKGIVRAMDHLGRITIPKEIRDVRGWNAGTKLEISGLGSEIRIRSYHERKCQECGFPVDEEYAYCPACGEKQR